MNERPHSIRLADEHISDEISERVRSVLSAAESAASAIRHEAEEQAQIHRRAVEAECARYIEDARRQAEELLLERVKRISKVSDEMLEGADSLTMRMDEANAAKQSLIAVVDALGKAAGELVRQRTELISAQHEAAPSTDASASASIDSGHTADQGGSPEREKLVATPPGLDEGESQAGDAPVGALRDDEVGLDGHRDDQEKTSPSVPALEMLTSSPGDGDTLLGARLVALQMAVAGGNRGEVEAHLRRAFELPEPGEILDDVFGAGSNDSKRVAWPETSDAGL